ncbi:hypothetical protein HRbin37_01627 [bacterium HR37]|nr:hypothetical protein HRbin37_01627 [bacterium HR37]
MLPTLGFIISFFSLIEYRIHNLNPIPDLQAQEIKTYPTQEELKRAKEILREFQKPEERVKGLGVGDSGSGIGKSQIPNTEDQAPNPQLSKPEDGRLFYFFSFSMPRESLKTILPEAEKTGAVMVLRGMKEEEGLKATITKIAELLRKDTGERDKEVYEAEIWIHPVLFTCFNIDSVPQIVYVTGTQDEEGCSSSYIKVKGDISLEYALRLFAKEDKSAKKYLKLLEDSFYEKD